MCSLEVEAVKIQTINMNEIALDLFQWKKMDMPGLKEKQMSCAGKSEDSTA